MRVFVIDYALNIIGSEWIIIIFVALILLFGTNKLPEAGKKIGKIVSVSLSLLWCRYQNYYNDGKYWDSYLLGLLRDEWQKLNQD